MSGVLSIMCVGDGVLHTLPYSGQIPQIVYAFDLITYCKYAINNKLVVQFLAYKDVCLKNNDFFFLMC